MTRKPGMASVDPQSVPSARVSLVPSCTIDRSLDAINRRRFFAVVGPSTCQLGLSGTILVPSLAYPLFLLPCLGTFVRSSHFLRSR